MDDGTTRNM